VPEPFQSPLRAILIVAGIVLLAAGVLWPFLSRYFGRLPGDIVVRREGWTFAFPIVTCLVLSVLISLLLWLFRR
jgi:formate hydrogenlyase subunit 3/multisubunit Na+/H+ antiporter MnhD subunit